MAYLMETDDDDVIHATTHGIMSREDLSFLRERMDHAVKTAGSYASSFLSAASEKLSNFNLGKLRDKVEGMRERFGKRFDDDVVSFLSSVGEFQQAKQRNKRYIMAAPRVRSLFQQGRLEGFGDNYFDEDPGVVGRDHTPYREVMNGSFDEECVDEDRFVTYLEVVDEHGDEPLGLEGRVAVRRSWKELYEILDRGQQDPTSPLKKTL